MLRLSDLHWVGQAAWHFRACTNGPLTGGDPVWRHLTRQTFLEAYAYLRGLMTLEEREQAQQKRFDKYERLRQLRAKMRERGENLDDIDARLDEAKHDVEFGAYRNLLADIREGV